MGDDSAPCVEMTLVCKESDLWYNTWNKADTVASQTFVVQYLDKSNKLPIAKARLEILKSGLPLKLSMIEKLKQRILRLKSLRAPEEWVLLAIKSLQNFELRLRPPDEWVIDSFEDFESIDV